MSPWSPSSVSSPVPATPTRRGRRHQRHRRDHGPDGHDHRPRERQRRWEPRCRRPAARCSRARSRRSTPCRARCQRASRDAAALPAARHGGSAVEPDATLFILDMNAIGLWMFSDPVALLASPPGTGLYRIRWSGFGRRAGGVARGHPEVDSSEPQPARSAGWTASRSTLRSSRTDEQITDLPAGGVPTSACWPRPT